MINYWNELVNYKQKKEMKRYFVADCDGDGEAIRDSIHEIVDVEKTIAEVREQTQEDIITYMGRADEAASDLCQIVVDNFQKLKIK